MQLWLTIGFQMKYGVQRFFHRPENRRHEHVFSIYGFDAICLSRCDLVDHEQQHPVSQRHLTMLKVSPVILCFVILITKNRWVRKIIAQTVAASRKSVLAHTAQQSNPSVFCNENYRVHSKSCWSITKNSEFY